MAVSLPIVSEFDGKGISKAIAEFKQLEGVGAKAQFAIKKAALPAAAALAGLAAAAGPAIGAASDLNETVSKTSVIFGDADQALFDFAENAATSLGQTKQQALDAAATFGTFGKAAGLTGGDLATFSTDFTKLASDLASFNNTSVDEAINSLGAALRGEAEPMRKFGVLLSADAVAAKALSMGLVTTTVNEEKLATAVAKANIAFEKHNETLKKHGEGSIEAQKSALALQQAENRLAEATEGTSDKLTAQQKTLATQALIMDATKDSQGDFARTSDGLANSQKILEAQLKNLQAEMGTVLLPIVEKAVQFFSGLATVMSENKDVALVVIGAIAGLAAMVLAVNAAMKVYTASMIIINGVKKAYSVITDFATIKTKAMAAAQAALNFVMSANPIALVVLAIGALVAAFVVAYNKSETFRKGVDALLGAIKTGVTASVEFIKGYLNTVMGFYKSIFNGIATLWNSTIGKLSFKAPDWVPGFGGKGFSVPQIPMLANGGIVTGPTLAMIGERGPEAVIPLNRAGAMGSTTINVYSTLADASLPDKLVNALRQYNRRSGVIDIAVA
jgi:hypothetical protein